MPKLTIDGKLIEVAPGATLLTAARQLGLDVPTLCYVEGGPHRPSCMACMMKIAGQNRYVASCATVAAEGMVVESESAEVRAARKMAFELLLSDHAGDCVAVCERRCPADVPIPKMIERIQAGKLDEAAALVREVHPFPATLGRICSAPCEKACRRSKLDEAVAIKELERQAGDLPGPAPIFAPETGKRVAVIGGGPAGLTAAFFLRQAGHEVTIFEATGQLGGSWRGLVPDEVLEREIAGVLQWGLTIHRNHRVTELPTGFAVVAGLTPGLEWRLSNKEPVQSVAAGREMAVRVEQALRGEPVTGERKLFTSTIAAFDEAEFARFAAQASANPRGGTAVEEAGRCFQCACGAAESCRLRHYADAYGAQQKHFKGARREFEHAETEEGVTFQRGKCISCGLCVWTSQAAGESVGLAFVKRGFEQTVDGALGASVDEAVKKSGEKCAEVCPTGAITEGKTEKRTTSPSP